LMKINGNPPFPLGSLSADFRQWEEGQRLQARIHPQIKAVQLVSR
jgi:hypothetical protein